MHVNGKERYRKKKKKKKREKEMRKERPRNVFGYEKTQGIRLEILQPLLIIYCPYADLPLDR